MRKLILLGMGFVLLTTAATCDEDKSTEQRRAAIHQRADAFGQATKIAPTPTPKNFPLRKALVEFTERQDLINHPWYVYILAETGNAIGYYVAKTVPINACDFLSATEEVRDGVKLTSPSLDGIFYGGGGASSGCDSWFFFDSATNALVQIRGVNWYAADQPLRIEAEPIKVGG